MQSRRLFLTTSLVCGAHLYSPIVSVIAPLQKNTDDQPASELQAGDPDLPLETLEYDKAKVRLSLVSSEKALGIQKNPRKFALEMVRVARSYVGVTRQKNPQRVEKLLALFAIEPRDSAGALKPFCAAGVSYCACQAYCEMTPDSISYDSDPVEAFKSVMPDINKFYFEPHCSCQDIAENAHRRGIWSGKTTHPAVGWLVFFDWTQTGVPNHVGIIRGVSAHCIDTIEFNTSDAASGNQRNGGAVAEKTRTLDYVLGYVRTYKA